jgi:hypothetical protein
MQGRSSLAARVSTVRGIAPALRGGAIAVLVSFAVAACDGSESDGDPPAADGGGALGGDGGAPPEPQVCDVEAPTSCPDPPVRYADVEPIFQERCVICHVGARGGPWPLTTYKHVSDWEREVRGVMLRCAMPPPDAGVPMTTDEREQILTWLECGRPE